MKDTGINKTKTLCSRDAAHWNSRGVFEFVHNCFRIQADVGFKFTPSKNRTHLCPRDFPTHTDSKQHYVERQHTIFRRHRSRNVGRKLNYILNLTVKWRFFNDKHTNSWRILYRNLTWNFTKNTSKVLASDSTSKQTDGRTDCLTVSPHTLFLTL